jgi:heat shock protein HslJ
MVLFNQPPQVRFRKVNKLRNSHSMADIQLERNSTLPPCTLRKESNLATPRKEQLEKQLLRSEREEQQEKVRELASCLTEANFKFHEEGSCMCG